MTSIVAIGAVTVGINLPSSHAELRELGLTPGSNSIIPVERMEEIRLTPANLLIASPVSVSHVRTIKL